jgi:hypothetical protein
VPEETIEDASIIFAGQFTGQVVCCKIAVVEWSGMIENKRWEHPSLMSEGFASLEKFNELHKSSYSSRERYPLIH